MAYQILLQELKKWLWSFGTCLGASVAGSAALELIKSATSELFLHQWHNQSASQLIQYKPERVTLSSCKDVCYETFLNSTLKASYTCLDIS